jgi:hypothetical protein
MLSIAKASQEITLAPSAKVSGKKRTYQLSATSTSGLPVTFTIIAGEGNLTGGTLLTISRGSVTIRASQAGDDNWSAAPPLDATIQASTDATVVFSNLTFVADGTAKTPTVVTSPAGLRVKLTYAGSSQPPSAAGTYHVVATIDEEAFDGAAEGDLIIKNKPQSRLVNLSARTGAGAGEKTLIMGFVVRSDNASTKQVLVRGVGPTLATSLPNYLPDPALELHDILTGKVIGGNHDWDNTPEMRETFARLGAQPFAEGSKDAAILAELTRGVYTAHVAAEDGVPGIALAEVYDADDNDGARLVNVSARAQVGTGADILIAGFVISGNAPERVLIRGIGPTLQLSGITGFLADPAIRLYHGSETIALNDNWGGDPEISATGKRIGAGDLISETSKDAAILITLDPGIYTVHVSGADGGTGVGLVEIYEVPDE